MEEGVVACRQHTHNTDTDTQTHRRTDTQTHTRIKASRFGMTTLVFGLVFQAPDSLESWYNTSWICILPARFHAPDALSRSPNSQPPGLPSLSLKWENALGVSGEGGGVR